MYNGKQLGDPVRGAKLAVEALAGMGRCENRVSPPRMAIGSHGLCDVTHDWFSTTSYDKSVSSVKR